MLTTLAVAAMTGSFVCPFTSTPDWGAMYEPAEWNRTYEEYAPEELVAIPKYNIKELTIPMADLYKERVKNRDKMTAKMYYSTRYLGKYNLDAGEMSGPLTGEHAHAGIDLKQPLNTPIRAIGAGKVISIETDDIYGLHIVIQHRGNLSSMYAHMDETYVKEGSWIRAGKVIGKVGMTGNTGAPHLHLELITGKRHRNPITALPYPCK